jgi:hypothetical protein
MIEPSDRTPDCVYLVLAFHETVTFIWVIMNIDHVAFFLKDIDNLLRFLLGHAWIIVAL